MLKWGGWSTQVVLPVLKLDPSLKIHKEICTDKLKFQQNTLSLELYAVAFVIISNVQEYTWQCTRLWRWLEEINHWNMASQIPLLLLQSNFIADNIFIIPCLFASVRCFFSNTCPTISWRHSVSPKPPVNFKTFLVLFLDSGSGSSVYSRTFCFRIASRSSSVVSLSGEFGNWKTYSTAYVNISALGLINWVWAQTREERNDKFRRRESGMTLLTHRYLG
jgi:hypothetical protein